MRITLIALLSVLGLSACAELDQYLPREAQCTMLDVAKAAAAERGLDVDTYLNTENLFVCAEVTNPAATELKVAE